MRKLSMFGLERLRLLNKTWIYPCNPSLHLRGQIGAACGKNSCLFSEIDKSIQITECKSQLEMAGKIHSAPLSLTPATSPSNEFQSPLPPSPPAAAAGTARNCRMSACVPLFIPWGAGREALCKRVEFVEIVIDLAAQDHCGIFLGWCSFWQRAGAPRMKGFLP